MTFEFASLSDKEKELIYSIEDQYPECVARDNKAGFDGATVLQLFTPDNITKIVAEIIKAVAVIAAARITANATIKASEKEKGGESGNSEGDPSSIVVFVTDDGERINVLTEDDLEVGKKMSDSIKEASDGDQ